MSAAVRGSSARTAGGLASAFPVLSHGARPPLMIRRNVALASQAFFLLLRPESMAQDLCSPLHIAHPSAIAGRFTRWPVQFAGTGERNSGVVHTFWSGREPSFSLHGVRANRLMMLDRARSSIVRDTECCCMTRAVMVKAPAISRLILESQDAAVAVLGWYAALVPGQRIAIIGVSLGGAAAVSRAHNCR